MFPLWPVLSALFLISVAGLNLACSKEPLPGNTPFIQAKKGFEKELIPISERLPSSSCKPKRPANRSAGFPVSHARPTLAKWRAGRR
jgi:hypothetical protein